MQRRNGGGPFLLAHVTDPHFRGFNGASPADFVGKRAVGALNLVVNRVRKHKMELLEALRLDLRAQAPDHLALTGDLANVSLTGEWRSALAWIDGCGARAGRRSASSPATTTRTCRRWSTSREFERLFAAYMTSDVPRDADYPYVQLRDELALIGVSSSVATGDLGAWGMIGEAQLARLEAALVAPEVGGKTRVVLIHHPPVLHKEGEKRNLRDRDALAAVLARVGADLVLHGHDHEDQRAELRGPGRPSDPGHRRRLGVVHGRPRAARALQRLRDRRSQHHLGQPRARRGDRRLQGSAPRAARV